MLRLTDLIGRPVVASDGRPVGSVADLVVHLGRPADAGDRADAPPHPEVSLLAVGRRHRIERYVRWEDVEDLVASGPAVVRVRSDFASSGPSDLADQELLLGRDVLDTQIFDVDGRRLARVAEVFLADSDDGHLHAAAVDVGLGAVWQRVGLVPLARRSRQQLVDWRSLHLTSARGHPVQLATTRSAVHRLDPDELVGLISEVSTEVGAAVLGSVAPEQAAAAVRSVSDVVGDRILRALPEDVSSAVLTHLGSERAARVRRQRAQTWPHHRRFGRHRSWRRRPEAGS